MMFGFLRSLFGRTPPSKPKPRDEREWNEDWEVGDLACCLTSDWPPIVEEVHPREGTIYRVSGICEAVESTGQAIVVGLELDGLPHAWICLGFKKVRPENKAADEAFTAELRDRLGVPA